MHGAIDASALRASEQIFKRNDAWDVFLTGLFKFESNFQKPDSDFPRG
jgi:hypothetical protein